MARVFRMRGSDGRMVPSTANSQPAVGAYFRGPGGTYEANSLQVFTLTDSGIARNVVFAAPSLVELFDLPLTLPA
jgi:RNA polymerase sigma-70 factor (ECF subfamily)